MLLQAMIAGGAAYAGLQKYQTHKKKKETPWTYYAERMRKKEKKKLLKSLSSKNTGFQKLSAEPSRGLFSTQKEPYINRSAFSGVIVKVQGTFQEIIAPYVDQTRLRQLQKLDPADLRAGSSDGPEISESEKKIRRNLTIASAGLILAAGGALFYPILYLPAGLSILYPLLDIYQDAYRTIVKQRQVDANVLNATMMAAAIGGGFFVTMALAVWYGMLIRLIVSKTEDRSRKSLVNLFGEQPRFVWVLVDGSEIEVPFENVQKGDVLVVTAGQTIPVDGVITTGAATIDQHKLTGESQPAEKEAGDFVLASTVVLSGKIGVRVEKTGQETAAAQIGEILNRTADFKLSIRSKVESFHDKMVPAMLTLSGMSLPWLGLNGALSVLWNYPGFRMLFFAPMSMLNFLHISSGSGILIKDGRALELLSDVDTIVFDKTGTLTLEQPYVSQIISCHGLSEDELLTYAAAAEYRQSHPIAKAILTAADKRQLHVPEIDHTHVEIGYGVKARLAGQVIRVGSERFMAIEGIEIPSEIKEQQAHCHAHGYSLVMVAIDDIFSGAIELRPTIRPEAKKVIHGLRERGKELVIISGDHEAPTRQLAQELGIEKYFANTLPENKADLVSQLQQEGRAVCFVGDGINDAIALKQANVSISLLGATAIATDTAQIVLMDQHLEQLTSLFDIAEAFKSNIDTTFMATIVPNIICIGGTLFLHWGFLTNVMIGIFLWFPQLANVMLPLYKFQNTKDEQKSHQKSQLEPQLSPTL